jgi:hypothetical protein
MKEKTSMLSKLPSGTNTQRVPTNKNLWTASWIFYLGYKVQSFYLENNPYCQLRNPPGDR